MKNRIVSFFLKIILLKRILNVLIFNTFSLWICQQQRVQNAYDKQPL